MSNKAFSMFKNEEELKEMEKTVETNSKKNLVIVPDGIYGLFEIEWDDGRGMLPEILCGRFTSQTQAEKAIKKYVKAHRTTKHKEKKERDEERDERIRQGVNYGKPFKESQAEEKEVEKDHTKVEESLSKEVLVEKKTQ